MAERKSCDICDAVTLDVFASGWGTYMGTDPRTLAFNRRDICPRCSIVVQKAFDGLRDHLGPKASPLHITVESVPALPEKKR